MAELISRGDDYYAVYYVGKKQKRVSLETSTLQLTKEKLRQLESSLYRGNDNRHGPILLALAMYGKLSRIEIEIPHP